MTKQYGLTKQTLDTYRELVQYGFNHDTAMRHLKELYEHNKSYFMSLQ